MSVCLRDDNKKYFLDWNASSQELVLSTWNYVPDSGNVKLQLTATQSIGSVRTYVNMFDFNSGSTTTVSTNTWTLLNATTTSLFSNGWTHSNNKLTYLGTTGPIKLEGIASVSAGSNNEIHFSFYRNGSIIPCSEQDTTTGSGGRANACPFHCVTTMSSGDYIEVWVKNVSSSSSIDLDNVNVILTTL